METNKTLLEIHAGELLAGDLRAAQQALAVTMGRSLISTIGGAATIILSILGLVGLYPNYFVPISTIAIGITLLFKGAAIASEYPKLLMQTTSTNYQQNELTGGMSIEFLAGASGIVLGILALLGLKAVMLCSIALIVFGVGLVAGSGVVSRLNTLKMSLFGTEDKTRRVLQEMVSTATHIQILVGLGAIVLGILSLLGIENVTLTLVGLLIIGAAAVLSGTSLTGKMMEMLR